MQRFKSVQEYHDWVELERPGPHSVAVDLTFKVGADYAQIRTWVFTVTANYARPLGRLGAVTFDDDLAQAWKMQTP